MLPLRRASRLPWLARIASWQQRFEKLRDLVAAQTALQAQRRLMLATPQGIVAQERDGVTSKALRIRRDEPRVTVLNALGQRADRLYHRRKAQSLRLSDREAKGFAWIAAIEHRPRAA